MKLPEGCGGLSGKVVELLKSLYGLSGQASRQQAVRMFGASGTHHDAWSRHMRLLLDGGGRGRWSMQQPWSTWMTSVCRRSPREV